MRELINGKLVNIVMLVISLVFLLFSLAGNIPVMAVVFGLYLLTFVLRLLLPVRIEAPSSADVIDAEYL